MELQGKIIAALPVKSGTSARGEWKVQEFVLETIDGQFPRKMVFSIFGEERLQRFNVQEGQNVTVFFDIDAHEYNGRWFNSIRAYDIRPIQTTPEVSAPFPQDAQNQQPAFQQPAQAPFEEQQADSADDLPF